MRALTANAHWSLRVSCHLFWLRFSLCVRVCMRACVRSARVCSCVCMWCSVCSVRLSVRFPLSLNIPFQSFFVRISIFSREREILNSTIYGFAESAAHPFLILWSEFSIDDDVYTCNVRMWDFLLLFSAVVACWDEFFPQHSYGEGDKGGGGRAVLLSLVLARSLARLTLYARTPHARTNARTLVVHYSRVRTLLISCPPETAAEGSFAAYWSTPSLIAPAPPPGRLPFRRPTKPRKKWGNGKRRWGRFECKSSHGDSHRRD